MATDAHMSYVVYNCLAFGFRALRNTKRNIENSLTSPYEEFFESLADALGQGKKLECAIPNSEVEGFYTKRMSEDDFISTVQTKLLSKLPPSGTGTVVTAGSNSNPCNGSNSTVLGCFNHLSLLFKVVWDLLAQQNAHVCNKLPKTSGKQLWEIFLKLDTLSELKVHVDDIVELILQIFNANGHHEKEENIIEWFCGKEKIDFWYFFGQLTEKYVGLLQIHIVHEIHTSIVSEFLKEGKLEKKGHVVHNWKSRWFVLTASALSYFESYDNLTLKGSVTINSNTLVQNMPEFKARPHRFRIVCGDSKTGTEISAPDSKTMLEWIYTIRMGIKIHQMEGRNFLHKYKQALAQMPTRSKGLTHSSSAGKMLEADAPAHRGLSPSKSVPLTLLPSPTDHRPLPSTPEVPSNENKVLTGEYEDSTDYKDPPPLPPQRFDSSDVRSLSKESKVFDKDVLIQARNGSRVISRDDDHRRHSSLEPGEVEHVQSDGGDYALISRDRFVKKKDPSTDNNISSLLSQNVMAQLSPDSTKQVDDWGGDTTGGYIQLHFHTENGVRKRKISPESSSARPPIQDFDVTKFGYSTVVFNTDKKTVDLECAERLKQNRSPPAPPPKYDSTRHNIMISDIMADSGVDFSDCLVHTKDSSSSPDLGLSMDGDESPYVNVRHNRQLGGPPTVPPRRGIAAPIESPPVPTRKTS